ncbi:MAG: SDR family oxidoreductase [Pseudomonadota bacterium]
MTDRPVALVTGASSGIGRALAVEFSKQGYDIVAVARRADKLAELKAQLTDARVYPVVLDLAKAKGPAKLLAATEELGLSIDVLVNNAGTAYQGPFEEMSEAQIRGQLDLNIRTLTITTHLFLPQIKRSTKGSILNVSSVVGFQAIPSMAIYAASKAFVLSFTESLAEELRADGVRVNALCPGLTDTQMVSDLGTDKLFGIPSAGSAVEFNVAQLIMDDPACVAKEAYQALERKQVITIPGMLNKLFIGWAEYQPRWFKRNLAGIATRMPLFK